MVVAEHHTLDWPLNAAEAESLRVTRPLLAWASKSHGTCPCKPQSAEVVLVSIRRITPDKRRSHMLSGANSVQTTFQ